MAVTLLGLSGFTWGLTVENGINAESHKQDHEIEMEEIPNTVGETRGLVFYNPKANISVAGEVSGAGGVAAATLGAAVTLANLISGYSVTAGGIYVKKVSMELGRKALKKISLDAIRCPLVA